MDSKSFSDELITEGRREHLAQRSVRWLRARHLDGMHVQWMYPGEGNGRPSDRENFPKLLAQIRNAFRASGTRPKSARLTYFDFRFTRLYIITKDKVLSAIAHHNQQTSLKYELSRAKAERLQRHFHSL